MADPGKRNLNSCRIHLPLELLMLEGFTGKEVTTTSYDYLFLQLNKGINDRSIVPPWCFNPEIL